MSELRKALHDYLALRRALGFKLRTQGKLLHSFVDYADRQGITFITRDFALRWALSSPHGKLTHCARRLNIVRRFAEYRAGTDPRTDVPPRGLLRERYRRELRYVYTDRDIPKIVKAALRLPAHRGLRATTFATIFGLLAITGLRIGECLRLDREDVDLAEGILYVRHSKFDKSRMVPLHPSACDALKHYARLRDRIFPHPKDQRFFISEVGAGLSLSHAQHTFFRLTRSINLRKPRMEHPPRLHDFRHGFAIRTLERLYRTGADVERQLPVLATYLGHDNVVGTYWYLTATPELLRLAQLRSDRNRREAGR
jgi:integrase/recombinase XerD